MNRPDATSMTIPDGWSFEPPPPDGYLRESVGRVCPECGRTGLHARRCSQPDWVEIWGWGIPLWKAER